MKRIILACAFIVSTGTIAMAQNAKQTPATQDTKADAKLAFASKINEISAVMSRGNVEIAQSKFSDIAGMMQTNLHANKNLAETNISAEEKTILITTINKQQHLYIETVTLAKDMKKNNTEIIAKLNEFLNTL